MNIFIISLTQVWIIFDTEEREMKYCETFSGIDCPNCALSIENEIKKQDGIERVEMDLMREKIIIEGRDRESIGKALTTVGRKYPKFRVKSFAESTAVNSTKRITVSEGLLFVGIVLFLVSLGMRFVTVSPLLFFCLSMIAYILIGLPVFSHSVRNLLKGTLFDENFLMLIASAGAFAVGEATEAVAVVLFYRIGEFFQDKAVERSRRSITALMDLRPDFARRESEGGRTESVPPESIEPGETIVVQPGEQIPLDGVILSGESSLDTSSLTGESMPRFAGPGAEVLSGFVNGSGVLRIRVTKRMSESTAARILELTENAASRKARTEKMITKFARIYTPLVVLAAVLTVAVPVLLMGAPFSVWIYRALIFLVISCPCALVISVPLGYFAGIGRASKGGILLKGSRVLEAFKRVRTVVFDKTGTLTGGRFRIRRLCPAADVSEEQLLRAAAVAESFSGHPLAICIREAAGDKSDSPENYFGVDKEEIECSEKAGFGITLRSGSRALYAGTRSLLEANGIEVPEPAVSGTAVCIGDETGFLGFLELFDAVRPEAASAVDALRKAGVGRIFMLTGDRNGAAKEVAESLGLDGFRAELLPGDKVDCFEELTGNGTGGTTLFVGDGINDAPVLARADVGTAMGGIGSDAAIEAADAVLMSDDISRLPFAVRLAKKTGTVITENIVFSLGVKAAVGIAAVSGYGSMWAAVFADVGVALLTVLNSMRILAFEKKSLDRKRFSVHTGEKSK